jgi:hypothetical protein
MSASLRTLAASLLLLSCTTEPASDVAPDDGSSQPTPDAEPDDASDTATEGSDDVEDGSAPSDGSATVERGPMDWLTTPTVEGATPRLLFIGVDGMRPDAMELANTPNFDLLRDNGTWTLTGTTQLSTDTDSSAGWTAITAGVDSTRTLVTDNNSTGLRDWSWPTFARVLRDTTGSPIVMSVHWIPFVVSLHEEDLTTDIFYGLDQPVTDHMAQRLLDSDASVFIVHLDDVDKNGHATGFSVDNPDYMNAIEEADAYTGQLIEALNQRESTRNEDWLVMVVTDHGGEGRDHGPMTPACQTIPFIFAGGSRARGEFDVTVSHLDVAPTIYEHFGILDQAPEGLQGLPR